MSGSSVPWTGTLQDRLRANCDRCYPMSRRGMQGRLSGLANGCLAKSADSSVTPFPLNKLAARRTESSPQHAESVRHLAPGPNGQC